MKFSIQANGYATLVNSKKELSQAARERATKVVDGKAWKMRVVLKDDDGTELCELLLDPHMSKSGNLTGRITLRGEGELVQVDATPTDRQVREASRSDKFKDLEGLLLAGEETKTEEVAG